MPCQLTVALQTEEPSSPDAVQDCGVSVSEHGTRTSLGKSMEAVEDHRSSSLVREFAARETGDRKNRG